MLEKAYCYELDEMVVAATALSLRKSEEYRALRFFCPEIDCVREVYPTYRSRNIPFYHACDHHKTSCRHDQRSDDKPPPGGVSVPRPPIDPTLPVPTFLGPLVVRPKQVKSQPTEQELRMLICAAKARPAYTPGTLEEVVLAWLRMSPEERKDHDLVINGRQFTYHTAFQIIAAGGNDIAALDWGQRIIYGKVTGMKAGDFAYFVDMKKMFDYDDAKKFFFATGSIQQLEPVKRSLGDLIAHEAVSAFLFGDRPSFNEKADKWHFPKTNDLYSGVVVSLY